MNIVLTNFPREKFLLLIEFMETKITSFMQFIMLDTLTILDFIKVKLPGIEDLLIEKTNLRIRREFFQKIHKLE